MFDFFKRKDVVNINQSCELNFYDNLCEYDELIKKIKDICGIDLEIKKSTIKSKLLKLALVNNIKSFSEFKIRLLCDLNFKQDLFNLITVCETYFFREIKQLKEIVKILKENPTKRKILSIPCSSGEEIYSILILAMEANIYDIEIFGIDINSLIIDKAIKAEYTSRSLYNVSKENIDKYFIKNGDKFILKKDLFNKVNYKVLNVFDNDFIKLGKFDLIISRNMMIYFDEEHKYSLIDNFSKVLNNNGMLFTGHADLVPKHDKFNKIYLNNCTYYQKI
ncbi:CheR family methyltransferase [Campylobacter sp. MG1]|uniref:CheR family methyltransferase n=1 Tax=Campylobacter sp. MG1 TaxID=2976332 RepID=UPI00226CD24A|nr:CheR family methyltransferase [Campylobacter sp. MG1]